MARSIICGQSVVISLFTIINLCLTIVLHKPRPGRLAGAILITASYLLAMNGMTLVALSRMGKPLTWVLWMGLATCVTGTLGVSLLIAHTVFHTDKGLHIVRSFFGEPEK